MPGTAEEAPLNGAGVMRPEDTGAGVMRPEDIGAGVTRPEPETVMAGGRTLSCGGKGSNLDMSADFYAAEFMRPCTSCS